MRRRQCGGRGDLAIVQAVAQLAPTLGIDVVGEGVETQAQADCLRDCGIFALKGWLYLPAIDNEALIAGFGRENSGQEDRLSEHIDFVSICIETRLR